MQKLSKPPLSPHILEHHDFLTLNFPFKLEVQEWIGYRLGKD
jgi:hypothetical protein